MKMLGLKETFTRRNYVYIAGPYSGRDLHGNHGFMIIEQNILNARAAMKELVQWGYGVFCPHTHSAHFEVITPEVDVDYWYELDIHFMLLCNAILRLPGKSSGADREVELCLEWGIPLFSTIPELVSYLPVFREETHDLADVLTRLRTGKL
jgi:hypothetical protein